MCTKKRDAVILNFDSYVAVEPAVRGVDRRDCGGQEASALTLQKEKLRLRLRLSGDSPGGNRTSFLPPSLPCLALLAPVSSSTQ